MTQGMSLTTMQFYAIKKEERTLEWPKGPTWNCSECDGSSPTTESRLTGKAWQHEYEENQSKRNNSKITAH